jgi:ABC-type ATPase with predicted acetyltransferase domain
MSPTAYDLLSSLLRFPKPTYMAGLTKDASAFLSMRLSQVPPEEPTSVLSEMQPIPLRRPLSVSNLTIEYEYNITPSSWLNAIQEAFGIDRIVRSGTGVKDLSLEIRPGQIIYVWGPSGSGKTGFLEVLAGTREPSMGTVSGYSACDCAVFSLDLQDRPAIDQVGARTLPHSLFSMNAAGLSEAALYFKHPRMLSAGQRHRLAIARLIASRKPVWIIDEFCSVLDDTTAAIVAKNVGRTARALGVTAIIAGPRREPVISALQPSLILNLDSLGRWNVEPLRIQLEAIS